MLVLLFHSPYPYIDSKSLAFLLLLTPIKKIDLGKSGGGETSKDFDILNPRAWSGLSASVYRALSWVPGFFGALLPQFGFSQYNNFYPSQGGCAYNKTGFFLFLFGSL